MQNAWLGILCRSCTTLSSGPRVLSATRLPCRTPQRIWQACINRSFSADVGGRLAPKKHSKQSPKQPANHAKHSARKPSANATRPHDAIAVKAPSRAIHEIFGKGANIKVGHEVLRELQSRRVSGALVDIGVSVQGFAKDITDEQATKALEWLRERYPIDEAAAAEQYAAIEDDKYRAELESKALKSFVYKEKKEETSPTAPPEEWSEEKRARLKEQASKIEALERKFAQEQAEVRLAVVEQQIQLAERRDEKLARWDELEKQAELDTEQLTDEKRSTMSRLAAPLTCGAVAIIALSFLLDKGTVTGPQDGLARKAWTAPDTSQLAPSIITCGGITAINVVVLLAWRNPRLWYSMNRLFLLSAGNPNTFSVLGSVFSHQRWIMHLAANTTLLFSLGMPLYDEIGRNNFLIVYLGSGIFASCSSLLFHVLRRNFLMASLGASGAVMGLYGAFFTVQTQRDLYIPYLDKHITYDTVYAILAFILLDVFLLVRTRGLKYDHVNHLGGLLAGVSFGRLLRPTKEHDRKAAPEAEYTVKVT